MSNDLTTIEGGQIAIPSYFDDLFGDESNVQAKGGTPQLSIRGKLFRIIKDGEETIMRKHDPETGEDAPRSMINIVVINQGERGARAYYEGEYDSSNTKGPDCFSLDGKVPSLDAVNKQSDTCASCPQAVKGSKMTPSGYKTTACALQRRLAIVPSGNLDFDPLLLRLASTSAWDPDGKANAEKSWYAWQQYCDFLFSKGVRHTAQVVTSVKFDDTEYPKLLFKPNRLLSQEEAAAIGPRMKSDEVMEILNGVGGDRGSANNVPKSADEGVGQGFEDGVKSAATTAEPEPAPAPQQAAPEPEPAPEPAPQKEPEKKAAPKQQATVSDDDDIGSALDEVLGDWG